MEAEYRVMGICCACATYLIAELHYLTLSQGLPIQKLCHPSVDAIYRRFLRVPRHLMQRAETRRNTGISEGDQSGSQTRRKRFRFPAVDQVPYPPAPSRKPVVKGAFHHGRRVEKTVEESSKASSEVSCTTRRVGVRTHTYAYNQVHRCRGDGMQQHKIYQITLLYIPLMPKQAIPTCILCAQITCNTPFCVGQSDETI